MGVVGLVDAVAVLEQPGFAPPGGVAADFVGPVLGKVLKDVGVNGAKVVQVEGPRIGCSTSCDIASSSE